MLFWLSATLVYAEDTIPVDSALESMKSLYTDMPPAPPREEALARQCPANIPLTAGKPPPPGFLDADGNVACGAIGVPTSHYADLLNTETWALDMERWGRLELAVRDQLLTVAIRDGAYWKGRSLAAEAALAAPPSFADRRWVNQASGAGTVLLAAVAIRLVNDNGIDLQP